ncbi:hypothetical protein CYMTET_51909 [Cymbomonas tetramitiformis]|uniref:BHLH domain-containing protein n=1 Tax=Cymbomonas tetramitiformis TaxID=36881 RepID=A0AAE0BK52_9CHLO|nr:hypothetical protein CYMTET_51909 [Cymbomonas tetramitiformis]
MIQMPQIILCLQFRVATPKSSPKRSVPFRWSSRSPRFHRNLISFHRIYCFSSGSSARAFRVLEPLFEDRFEEISSNGGARGGGEMDMGFTPSEGKHKVVLQGEYTFTDRELQDTLGTFEMAENPAALQFPPLWSLENSESVDWQQRQRQVPLQFQPHLPQTAQRHPNMPSSHQQHYQGESQWVQRQQQQQQLPSMFGSLATDQDVASYTQIPASTLQAAAQVYSHPGTSLGQDALAVNNSLQFAQLDPDGMGDGPTKVSHGASEKQRRDRINAMIDQLRKLVPPGGVLSQPMEVLAPSPSDVNVLDGKRSKYVVLAESIKFISVLQRQVEEQASELAQLRARQLEGQELKQQAAAEEGATSGPPSKVKVSNSSNWTEENPIRVSGNRERSQSAQSVDSDPELKVKTESLDDDVDGDESPKSTSDTSSHGDGNVMPMVVVDIAPEICYIKVTCRDRRGLLADILNAFAPLPLEVNRAAIATSKDSVVTDIFEVTLDDGCCLGAEEIRNKVQSSLYEANMLCSRGDKKRRHLYFNN